jgi:hypothetical protein
MSISFLAKLRELQSREDEAGQGGLLGETSLG